MSMDQGTGLRLFVRHANGLGACSAPSLPSKLGSGPAFSHEPGAILTKIHGDGVAGLRSGVQRHELQEKLRNPNHAVDGCAATACTCRQQSLTLRAAATRAAKFTEVCDVRHA
jgi:hypothetical protein